MIVSVAQTWVTALNWCSTLKAVKMASVFGAAPSSLADSVAVAVSVPSMGWTMKVANELHLLKAPSPMLVTDDGIARLANELHPLKAWSPMLVTDDGIARLANALHPLKASSPIAVTESGMLIDFTFALAFHAQSLSERRAVPSGMSTATLANELH